MISHVLSASFRSSAPASSAISSSCSSSGAADFSSWIEPLRENIHAAPALAEVAAVAREGVPHVLARPVAVVRERLDEERHAARTVPSYETSSYLAPPASSHRSPA